MSISSHNNLRHFILVQVLCLFCYLFFVLLLYTQDYSIIEFWYCLPFIVFFQIIFYFLYWYPIQRCRLPLLWFSIPFCIIESSIFLGVFFGLFGNTLQYHVKEVSQCSVIGKESIFINSWSSYKNEIYSLLYVDFKMDDQQLLGYSCLSSRYNGVAPQSQFDQNPYQFVFEGDIDCIMGVCYDEFAFSKVKLPSWFCLSDKTSHEYLVEKRNCYVYFYPDNSNNFNSKAYQNSLNREPLRQSSQFAMITFKKLLCPFDDYFCLLVFCLCPIIPCLSILFIDIVEKVEIEIKRSLKQYKYYQIQSKFEI